VFGIGFPELLLILAIALMVIGPRRLPEIAKALGRAMGEFKRATDEFKQSINEETRATEIREQILKGGKIYPPDATRNSAGKNAAESDRPEETPGVNPRPTPLGPQAGAEKKTPKTETTPENGQPTSTDDDHDG